MPKIRAKLATLAVAGACAFTGWKIVGGLCGADAVASARHLHNRPWIERVPRDDRDIITHLTLLDTDDGRFGAAGRSSAWRHVIEIFRWHREDDRLTLDFPQERVRAEFEVRTWECEGEAPRPFQLCLELRRQGRALHLYSRHDWEIEPHDAPAARAEAIAADAPAEARPLLRRLVDVPAPAPGADAPGRTDEAAVWSLLGG